MSQTLASQPSIELYHAWIKAKLIIIIIIIIIIIDLISQMAA